MTITELISLCQVYLGADRSSEETSDNPSVPAWKKRFRAVEIVLHSKYNKTRKRGKITTYREDYDVALLRIEYPAVDEANGTS